MAVLLGTDESRAGVALGGDGSRPTCCAGGLARTVAVGAAAALRPTAPLPRPLAPLSLRSSRKSHRGTVIEPYPCLQRPQTLYSSQIGPEAGESFFARKARVIRSFVMKVTW